MRYIGGIAANSKHFIVREVWDEFTCGTASTIERSSKSVIAVDKVEVLRGSVPAQVGAVDTAVTDPTCVDVLGSKRLNIRKVTVGADLHYSHVGCEIDKLQ